MPSVIYVTGIIASDDGAGGPDFTDDCLALSSTQSVSLLDPVTVTLDPNYVCDNQSSYSATIAVSGGSGSYQVTASSGNVIPTGGGAFTVSGILNNATSTITVSDISGCAGNTLIAGPFDCYTGPVCTAVAGQLAVDNQTVCFNGNATATATGFTAGAGQNAYVVFHNAVDPATALPTTVYGVASGTTAPVSVSITNDGTLPAVVYATVIVATDDGAGGPDFNDQCIEIGNTIALSLLNTIQFSASTLYNCASDNLTYSGTVQASGGSGNYIVTSSSGSVVDAGNGTFIINGIPSQTTASVTLVDDCGSEQLILGPFDCYTAPVCSGDTGQFSVNNATICSGASTSASATGFSLGAGQNMYVVFHDAVNPSVTLPTTVYAISSGTSGTVTTVLNDNGSLPSTLYATAIVATDDGNGGPDFTDQCIEISSTFEITILPALTFAASANFDCAADGLTYSGSVQAGGGNGNYLVTTTSGTVTDNGNGAYTIAGITDNMTAVVTLTDACGSQQLVLGPFDCYNAPVCTADAGNVMVSPSDACSGETIIAMANGFNLDAGQELFLVFHDSSNPTVNLPTVIYAAESGTTGNVMTSFVNSGVVPPTVYVTAIAAAPGTTFGIDFSDPCIDLSPTLPVNLLAPLSLIINNDYECNGESSFNVSVTVGGGTNTGYSVASDQGTVTDQGNSVFLISGIANNTSAILTLSDSNGCEITAGTGSFDCTIPCSANAGTLSLTDGTLCDGQSASATATGFSVGAGQQMYLVYHNASDPALNLPTSIYAITSGVVSPLSLDITNDGSLPNVIYVTAIVAEDDGNGGPDFTDPCLALSSTLALTNLPTLTISAPFGLSCETGNATYSAQVTVTGGTGSINVITTSGNVIDMGTGTYVITGIPEGTATVINATDASGCTSGNVSAGPLDCEDPFVCEANAGVLTPPAITTVCDSSGFVQAPLVTGSNLDYDYLFLLTNSDLDIVSISGTGAFDLTGFNPGNYCVHGLSYDEGTDQAPNLNITNAAQLLTQTDACFDLIVDACYTITVLDCGEPAIDCDANAGNLLPIMFDEFCTLNADEITLPLPFGQNPTFDYLFVITNSNLDIVATSSNITASLTGQPEGEYCIHGLSYDADSPQAPNLNITNVSELFAQTDACFDLILEDCVTVTIQGEGINPAPPVGPSDTTFLCTQYITPIDFCIDIIDPDGGNAYLVDLISFCNPSIVGDNCVHYPPLPGLTEGMDETISLIYCDDDCPQECDTAYVNISIIPEGAECVQDTSGVNPTVCNPDTLYYCTGPITPFEICLDCEDATGYEVTEVNSMFNCSIDDVLGTCFTYTPLPGLEDIGEDVIEVVYCQDGMTNCVTQVIVMTVGDCTPPPPCPEIIYACTAPIVPIDICLECEFDFNPNYVITNVESYFDQCTIDEIGTMCIEYIPLPLMDLLGTDTVTIEYCDQITGECDETLLVMTFSNCDNLGGGGDPDPDPDPEPVCEDTYFGCSPPITPFDFCLDCQLGNDPDIEIQSVNSLFNCGIDDIEGGCFTYTPLPSMDQVGSDTVTIVYCDMNTVSCDSAFLIMTFENCDDDGFTNPDDDKENVTQESCPIDISNALSPNNDGINDAFRIDGLDCYDGNHLTVFDRFGNIIFETENYKNDWRGLNRANNSSDIIENGTYFYILTVTKDNQNKHPFSGFIEVVR